MRGQLWLGVLASCALLWWWWQPRIHPLPEDAGPFAGYADIAEGSDVLAFLLYAGGIAFAGFCATSCVVGALIHSSPLPLRRQQEPPSPTTCIIMIVLGLSLVGALMTSAWVAAGLAVPAVLPFQR